MAGGCGECVPLVDPRVPVCGDVAVRRTIRVSRILRSRRIPLVPFGPAALESCTSPRPGIRRRLDVGVGHADLSPAGRGDHDRAPVAPADGLDRTFIGGTLIAETTAQTRRIGCAASLLLRRG